MGRTSAEGAGGSAWAGATGTPRDAEERQGHRSSSALLLLNAERKLVEPKGFGPELSVETTNTGWSVSLRDVKTRSRKMHDWSLVAQPMGQPAQTGSISPFSFTRALHLFWPRPPRARPSSPAWQPRCLAFPSLPPLIPAPRVQHSWTHLLNKTLRGLDDRRCATALWAFLQAATFGSHFSGSYVI